MRASDELTHMMTQNHQLHEKARQHSKAMSLTPDVTASMLKSRSICSVKAGTDGG